MDNMDTNVSEQVIEVLNHLSSKIGISIDWSQQNILPQVQDFMARYVQYKTQTNILGLIMWFLLLGLGVFLIYKGNKICQEGDIYGLYELWYVFGIVVVVLSIMFMMINITELIKLNTVPEMYLMELVKGYLIK